MTPSEASKWFEFIQNAPEGIRDFLAGSLYLFVFLFFTWLILKLLRTREFRGLYSFVGYCCVVIINTFRAAVGHVSSSLELPEPYPRMRFVFTAFSMLTSYMAFLIFLAWALVMAYLMAFSPDSDGVNQFGGVSFIGICGFFARFFFVQAETDRIALRRNDS